MYEQSDVYIYIYIYIYVGLDYQFYIVYSKCNNIFLLSQNMLNKLNYKIGKTKLLFYSYIIKKDIIQGNNRQLYISLILQL